MNHTLDTQTQKQLRGIGHKLKPVVTIATKGLTANILEDLDTRLEKNELIKIKLVCAERDIKKNIINDICTQLHAQLVQQLGNTALLFRAAEKPNPKLSNLQRVI